MSLIPCFENIDAANDNFKAIEFGNSSVWSVSVDKSLVTTDNGEYSILVSNHTKVEADMMEYKAEFTGKLLSETIFSDNFHYKYFAIKYVSNGSVGTVTIYLERKKKEVILV